MTSLCLINQKGGCGKSSTCFHLAGAYAATGRRVLLVDADPQGSISQGFLGSQVVESLPAERTLALLFDESLQFRDRSRLVLSTGFDGIDLVPANYTLARHNAPEPERTGDLQYMLSEFLSDKNYDIVLIDCPPNLYACSWNAMIAATHVVIPVPPEDFGTQGIRSVHQAIANARTLNPMLRRLGHLLTRVDGRLVIHNRYAEKLRDAYGSYVLDTQVPEAAAFKVSLSGRRPVEFYDRNSKAAQSMRRLASEIDQRVSVRHPLVATGGI